MTDKQEPAIFALAENVVNYKDDAISPEVATVVKKSVLDILGVIMAATTTRPANKRMVEFVENYGGQKESTVIGGKSKVSAEAAAAANAMQGMSINLQDRHVASFASVGEIAFPVAMALVEKRGKVSGKEFITAYALGMDVMGRIGGAAEVRKMYIHGWLIPHILEHFIGATIASRLLKLNKEQTVSAYGIVFSQLGGSKEGLYSGHMDWGLWSGLAARSAISSAFMAKAGINAYYDCLEGHYGLLNLYFGGEYKKEPLTADLGKTLKGMDLGFQAFPCSPVNTAWIVLALKMVKQHHIRPDDIQSVKVFTVPRLTHCFEPWELRRNPQTIGDAQMAIPFCVATAIVKGIPRLKHFTDVGIKDPDILKISNKVVWEKDDKYGWSPTTGDDEPGKIEITLNNGQVISCEELGVAYGHPDKPMTQEDLIDKFKDCVSYYGKPLPEKNINALIQMIGNLEELNDVTEILHFI